MFILQVIFLPKGVMNILLQQNVKFLANKGPISKMQQHKIIFEYLIYNLNVSVKRIYYIFEVQLYNGKKVAIFATKNPFCMDFIEKDIGKNSFAMTRLTKTRCKTKNNYVGGLFVTVKPV